MNRPRELTLAYLELAPQAAARVLENLEARDAAAFLETVPARLSAPVVDSMIPWYAARCLELTGPALAAGILRQLAFDDTVSLVRLLGAQTRDAVCAELPAGFARRLGRALRYPRNQVGAWVDPGAPTLRTSDTVDDALRLLRESAPASHVFVESEDEGTFVGAVSVKSLLRGRAAMRISLLPIGRIEPLSSREPLAAVAFDARWDEFLCLPVVGRRGSVLGGLFRQALHKGLREQRVPADVHAASVWSGLLEALIVTCSGVLRLAMPSSARVRRANRQEVSKP